MPRCDGSEAARDSAANILALLGLLCLDGRPITFAECWRRKVILTEEIARLAQLLTEMRQDPAANVLTFSDLVDAHLLAKLHLHAWKAIEAVLFAEAGGP